MSAARGNLSLYIFFSEFASLNINSTKCYFAETALNNFTILGSVVLTGCVFLNKVVCDQSTIGCVSRTLTRGAHYYTQADT